jgi:hypothetical protein
MLRKFLIFHIFRRAVNFVVLGGWFVRRHGFPANQIVFIPFQAFDVLALLIQSSLFDGDLSHNT